MLLVLAHRTAGLSTQGLDSSILLYLTIAALVVGALALRITWLQPRFGPADPPEQGDWPGAAMPRALRSALRLVGLAALLALLLVGWAGSTQFGANPVWLTTFVVFWTGGLALSALIGDWWRLIDPFESLAVWISGREGSAADRSGQTDDSPDRSWWVPAALLASFLWFMPALGWTDGVRPRSITGWITAYTLVMAAGAVGYGVEWVRRNEVFALVFGLVSLLSPLDWSSTDAVVVVRNPLSRVGRRRVSVREAALVPVIVGAVVFDAVGSTQWWADTVGVRSAWGYTAFKTAGFGWTILITAVVWVAFARLVEAVASPTSAATDDATAAARGGVALALVPPTIGVAVGFVLAHDLGSFVIDIQTWWAMASDPLAKGWDLFGSTRLLVDPQLLPYTAQVWVSLLLALVALGTTLVGIHDRCAARYDGPGLARTTWPVLGLLVLTAVTALKLLLSP